MAHDKVIPHPDPVLRDTKRFLKAVDFFRWLDDITMSMWKIDHPKKKYRRKYAFVHVDANYNMLEKLKIWQRLKESGLRLAPTYTKGGNLVVFRIRFDCFECAQNFVETIRIRVRNGD